MHSYVDDVYVLGHNISTKGIQQKSFHKSIIKLDLEVNVGKATQKQRDTLSNAYHKFITLLICMCVCVCVCVCVYIYIYIYIYRYRYRYRVFQEE